MTQIKIDQIGNYILLLEIGFLQEEKSYPFYYTYKLSILQPIFDTIEREIGGGQVIMMSLMTIWNELMMMMMLMALDDDDCW